MSTDFPTPAQLLAGSSKSLFTSDLPPGTTKHGTVLSVDARQMNKFGTTDPDFWPDGKPKCQMIVNLQTDESDPDVPEDDGVRTLYTGSLRSPGSLLGGIGAACRKANIDVPQIGGRLIVTYTGNEQNQSGGGYKKLWTVVYQPPAPNQAAAAELLADPSPQAAGQPIPPPHPVSAPTGPAISAPAPSQLAPQPVYQQPPAAAQPVYQQPAQTAPVAYQPPAAVAPQPAGQTPAQKARDMLILGIPDHQIIQVTGVDQSMLDAIKTATGITQQAA